MSFARRSPLTLSAATWDSDNSVVSFLNIGELEKGRAGREATFGKCSARRTEHLDAAHRREIAMDIISIVGCSSHFSIGVQTTMQLSSRAQN